MPLVSATPPASTEEFAALSPLEGETPGDALARVGDGVVTALGVTPDKKLPRQLAGLIVLRTQGFDNREIADRLGVSVPTIKRWIAKARREYGWSDLSDKLMHTALPQAVDNIVRHLEYEGTDAAIANDQSTMTRELAKGLGTFKSHQAVKSEKVKTSIQVLKVQIELPPGVQGTNALVEGVLATPRRALPIATAHPAPAAPPVIDAEVIAR